jgi:hypothetical protein
VCGRNGVKIDLRLSTARNDTKSTVAARSRSVFTSAQGAWSEMYWFTVDATRIASPSDARKRPASMCAPTLSNPR